MKQVACPQCQQLVTWSSENKYRPFCSERCQKIDLGAWASDEYKIAGAPANSAGTPLTPSDPYKD